MSLKIHYINDINITTIYQYVTIIFLIIHSRRIILQLSTVFNTTLASNPFMDNIHDAIFERFIKLLIRVDK